MEKDNKQKKVKCPVCSGDRFIMPLTIMGRIAAVTKIQVNAKNNGMLPAVVTSCQNCGAMFNLTILQQRAALEAQRIKDENNINENKNSDKPEIS